MGKILEKINAINEWIAIKSTLIFGTMWMFYAFFLYGFAPLYWPSQKDNILYWSNVIQLFALPLLMVGTNLLGRVSEKRNQEMYDMIKLELANSSIELAELKEILAELNTSK